MAKKKYDLGKLIGPIIFALFFLFLSFPVFIKPRLSWIAAYILFLIIGFLYIPLTDKKRIKASSGVRFILFMLHSILVFCLFYIPTDKAIRVYSGIVTISAAVGIFSFMIYEEVLYLKSKKKRKKK